VVCLPFSVCHIVEDSDDSDECSLYEVVSEEKMPPVKPSSSSYETSRPPENTAAVQEKKEKALKGCVTVVVVV